MLVPQEVEFIWKAPRNVAGLCVLLFRYATVAAFTIGTNGKRPGMHCSEMKR
jgi:hypothetical protein